MMIQLRAAPEGTALAVSVAWTIMTVSGALPVTMPSDYLKIRKRPITFPTMEKEVPIGTRIGSMESFSG